MILFLKNVILNTLVVVLARIKNKTANSYYKHNVVCGVIKQVKHLFKLKL